MFLNNKSISTTKPINYTISNNAYWFGNAISDLRVWIYGTAVKEIKNDFISKIDKNQKSYEIKLGKYNLEYRVYKLQDGTYNIGRIILKKLMHLKNY